MLHDEIPTMHSGYKCLSDEELAKKHGSQDHFEELLFDTTPFLTFAYDDQLIPIGYYPYQPEDFRKYFGISEKLSIYLSCDYRLILNDNYDTYIFEITKEAGATRNIKKYQDRLIYRYNSSKKVVAPIAQYLSYLWSGRHKANQQNSAGIKYSEWCYHPLCKCPGHKKANGKRFECSKGLEFNGVFILPGVAMGCDCMGMSVVPGT